MNFLESDIRPAELHDEYLRLSAIDAKLFFGDPKALISRSCPGCQSTTKHPQFRKNGFNLVQCGNCRSLFVDPAPDDESLTHLYNDSPSTAFWANQFFPAVAEARRSKIFKPRAEEIHSILSKHNEAPETIIDVGAGAGLFLDEFKAFAPMADLCAIEPGAILADNLRDKDVKVFEGYASDAATDSNWRAKGDLVTCFEVIEHIVDVDRFFSDLRDLCRPGGMIIVTGLSGTGFDIGVLGEKSKAVSPPHHLTFLSRIGTEKAIERCSLELLSFFTPGVLDVDIVRNAALLDSEILKDQFFKDLILNSTDETRNAFQEFLQNNLLSSHMWIIARRPESSESKIGQK